MKPRIFLDIQSSRVHPFSRVPYCVNLFIPHRVVIVPLKRLFVFVSLFASLSYFLFGSVLLAPDQQNFLFAAEEDSSYNQLAQSGTFVEQTREEREQLEQELADLEKQILEQEATVRDLRSQGSSLKSEITRLESSIEKLRLQIKAVNISLTNLDQEIQTNELHIIKTEEDIAFNKEALIKALQKVYEHQYISLIEVLLENPQLSSFFGNINNLLEVQNTLSLTIEKVEALQLALLNEKELLGIQYTDAQALKEYRANQQYGIEQTKSDRKQLLVVTQGKEAKYQELLQETKKTAAEIRSRIFRLLGGGELTFEQAYEFAKLAEGATGVRAALILAVLSRESALGRNVGQCPYYDEKTGTYYMHPKRDVQPFLEITAKLGLNAATMLVSCPNSDGAYGGAMGPAQFIPSTWLLFENAIARVTGNDPPSPWRNADAFAATALYLDEAYDSSGCIEYSKQIPEDARTLRERCAAAKYYAGGNWHRFRWAYGEPVVKLANELQGDIDILES